jgi:hypothetical protein
MIPEMPELNNSISDAVEAQSGRVSIAEAIQRVRELVSTSETDEELQNLIGTTAAYLYRPILFDRLK